MKTKKILSLVLCLIMVFGMMQTVTAEQNGNDLPDAVITVPTDSELFVGQKAGNKHFVSFTEMPAALIQSDLSSGTTSYYFELTDNQTYNYRISSDNFVTYAGTFKKTADFNLNITSEMLQAGGEGKSTIDRTASNNGYNVADIYLNINPQGHLKLNTNDTYQLVPLRNWEAVNSTSANYFIEPDVHYEVVDEYGEASTDVISIDENGLITALQGGTAIVLVTYDSMNLDFGSGKQFYGAIWPENTGVFVVSVDGTGFDADMTINEGKNNPEVKLAGDLIDAEHDVIYFIGEVGEYVYRASEDVTVSVANPIVTDTLTYNGFNSVEKTKENTFNIPLVNGRNIVKVQKGEQIGYQVITAKSLNFSVNAGEVVHPGDALNVVFESVYHPANKLAGVYNMNAVAVYESVYGYNGKIVGGLPAQYNFAVNPNAQSVSNVLKEKNVWGQITYEKDTDLIVPADYPYDTFTLSGGMIYVTGWGDSYGNHRGITLTDGKAPNLNADPKHAWIGKLPDIIIPIVVTTAPISSISLDTTNVKTNYLVGEKFDAANLVVIANYADSATQIATNYQISPEIMTPDTSKVTVTYRGAQSEIEVSVREAKVTSLELTKAPDKVSYNQGDTFSPEGMVISAIFEDGSKKVTTDYTYAPNRELASTDTAIIVTYTGENAADEILPLSIPVTVSEASGGVAGTSGSISVTVTLMGDDKHGEPTENSGTHSLVSGNLKTWINASRITLDKGSCVLDAIKKALSIAGIPYSTEGGYINSVKGLSEFDNGSYSGWMYTLNGVYPSLGVTEQILRNNDRIVFHYTDDYTVERSIVSGGGGLSSVVKDKTEDKNEEVKNDLKTDLLKTPEQVRELHPETFKDIQKSDWHYEAVKYVYEKNLMQGTEAGFEPESKMTRAMLVTVIYRMENAEANDFENKFSDIKENQWYSDAVLWAAEKGIVSGTSENTFSPDEEISREQLALIFYRYAKMKGYNTEKSADITKFNDVSKVSDWAVDALMWANGDEIITGTSNTTVSPKESATRAQVATILMRFIERI